MTTPESGHVDVAAYALGALDDTDTEQFEDHLVWCDECARELERMLPTVVALSRVDRDAYVPTEESLRQDHLLDRMANVVALERRRAWAQRTLAVAAAIAVLVVATLSAGFVGTRIGDPGSPQAKATTPGKSQSPDGAAGPGIGGPENPPGDRYVGTDPASGVNLEVFLDAKPWGTQVALSLAKVTGPLSCQLVAVDRSGASVVIGTWRVSPQGYGTPTNPEPLFLQTATAVARTNLLRIQVVAVTADNKAVDLVGVAV